MVTIQIKTEVVEWLMEHEGWDAEEALAFAQEFVGMLYFTGAAGKEWEKVVMNMLDKQQLDKLGRIITRLFKKNRATRIQDGDNSKSMIFHFCWGYEEALKDIAAILDVELIDSKLPDENQR